MFAVENRPSCVDVDAPGAEPAWYLDPFARHRLRYWDGRQWTGWVADGTDPVDENATAIVVTRRRGWVGRIVRFRVFIDGELAGRVANGETRTFFVPAGTHRVRVKQTYLASRELDVSVPPNRELRCGYRGGGIIGSGLSLVQPRRSLALGIDSDADRPSPMVAAIGVFAWAAMYVVIVMVAIAFAH